MENREVSTLQLALIAGTRVVLGIGIGLLIAGALEKENRKLLGRVLLGAGIASTFPIARSVFHEARGRTELAA
jgi:F0F1-type ATP synthase assembly protein I